MAMLEADEVLRDADGGAPIPVEPQDDMALAELAAISLPSNSIKRIVKSAAPGVRFSSEAIAGFHRVAQAFALFATDRALAEQVKEAEKARKSTKSKHAPPLRKNLTAEHVMRFLTSEIPQIGTKISALFPDLMPPEFKPAGVQLLEQLHQQSKAPCEVANSEQQQLGVAVEQYRQGTKPQKRPREDSGIVDSVNQDSVASKSSAGKKAKTAKAPAAGPSSSLSTFFGASKALPKSTPVATDELCEALPKISPIATDEAPHTSATVIEEAATEDAQPRDL
jgi:histone H3/H4